ncbi:hypothetical protein [Rhodococcus marinonascens]|uniref:hypothetical protein n=1 Tax=Rhodococcus marinonascens TaxID=38311 RepID=UPI000932208D|nr:hypothetical protein [Rhodococcus marinonascens]
MTESPPVIEMSVVATPSVVWPALRDPELIKCWHGWDYEGLDEEIRQIYLDGVAAEDAGAYSLLLTSGDRFSLHEHEGTTLVRITRAPRGRDPAVLDWYDDITEGWTTFLQFLKFGIEWHGLDERRTLFLEGSATVGDTARHLLGLDEITGLKVGERFRTVADTGDQLSGFVFFIGDHQTVVTVDDLGPGLLEFGEQPVTSTRPNGGSQILLGAYGLDDEEWGELEERWTRWWRARPSAEPST